MNQQKGKGLVPELRFPEFRGGEMWRQYYLSEVTDGKLSNGVFNDPNKVGKGFKLINVADMYVGTSIDERSLSLIDIPEDEFKKNKVLCEDIFFTRSSLVKAGIAHSNIYLGFSEDITYDGHLIRLRPNKKIVFSLFLHHILKSEAVRSQLISKGKSATMTTIGQRDIADTYTYIPLLKEQQKIADCLSSLDELITAHKQKLEALKAHKQGLMQQLFPAEGEAVPKLRFPEFRDAGEWKLKPFSESIKLYRGSSPRPIKEYLTKSESGVNWIKIGDTSKCADFTLRSVSEKITSDGAEKSRRVKKGELILANSMSYGATYLLEVEGCIYDGWFVLREYEDVFDKQFLLQLLNSRYIQNQYKRMAAGGVVQNISSEIVYSALLPITSKNEQQKISEFLTSIDDLIEGQSKRIELLKALKKGLMQQLFPSVGGVSA